MTTAKPPSGAEVQHWRPFTEMFPWNTRLGQMFENMWQAAGHEGLTPGAELEETHDGFASRSTSSDAGHARRRSAAV